MVFQERQVSDAVGKAWGSDGWAFHRLRGHLFFLRRGAGDPKFGVPSFEILGTSGAQLFVLISSIKFWGGSIQFGTTAKEYCRNVCFGRCIAFCLAPGPFVDIPCWRECEIIIQILIYGWGIWGNLSPYNKMARYLEPNQIASQSAGSHQGNSAKGNRKVSYIELSGFSNCKKGFLSKNPLRFVQPDLILALGVFHGNWTSAPRVGNS